MLHQLNTNFLSWMHQTPLPSNNPDATIAFQSWHQFDIQQGTWVPFLYVSEASTEGHGSQEEEATSPLTLMTWNIDSTLPRTQDRVAGIFNCVDEIMPRVDVLFLQEVSRSGLKHVLDEERIRASWLSSECDDKAWGRQSFATMTLLRKSRFTRAQHPHTKAKATVSAGPIWRVRYPSRFQRDALCCDIFLSSPHGCQTPQTRVRLINVHLDSLPIRPSNRPRQLSIASSFLRSVGRGLVAGDFNPVMDEDELLVEMNGLTDAWTALRPDDLGLTWGTEGDQPFPAARLDKVALLGLRAVDVRVVEARRLGTRGVVGAEGNEDDEESVLWSDHHGLLCAFALPEEYGAKV